MGGIRFGKTLSLKYYLKYFSYFAENKMSKITLSSNPKTTNTTTINLGGVKHVNEKNRCIIKSIATSQPLASKVTQTLGTMQPRIITLPASLSTSKPNATIITSSSQNVRVSIPSVLSTKPSSNTILKPIQATSLKTTNIPQQIVPAKVVNLPIKNNLQPVKMTVSSAVASSGQTGHTMIFKKAGKIETFPVPTSTPAHISTSLVNKKFENSTVSEENVTNNSDSIEKNSIHISNVMNPKATNSEVDKSRGPITHSQPIQSNEINDISNGTTKRSNQITSTVTFHHSGHISQVSVSKSISVLQQAAPDSTSCNVEPTSGDSNRDRDSNRDNCHNPLNSHQIKNSFSSLDQTCGSQTTINHKSAQINESVGMMDLEENSNSNQTTKAIHQDDSINSSNESIDKNNVSSYLNVSNFSVAPLKRSNSATVDQADQFVGGIDPPNDERIKENPSIIQEHEYPAAKKSKL